VIAAVDPGGSGGMAWQDSSGEVKTCSMANRGEFTMAIGQAQGLGQNSDEEPPDEEIIVYIEKVTGFIPRRKQSDGEEEAFNLQNSSHLMFNFGKNYGIMLGICEGFGITPVEVMPTEWQRMTFTRKSGTRQAWKNQLKEIAQRRFPDVKVTLSNCDALLILSYAMLKTRGSIDIAPEKR